MIMATQKYLGIPNAVVLCIDAYEDDLRGYQYDLYHTKADPFHSELEMLLKMEKLYDDLNFPFPGNNERYFNKKGTVLMKEKLEKVMKDDDLLEMHGDLGTFIVRVQHRQNSSWQGRITWVEEDKTVYFRSVWEMMKLIEEALGENKETEDPSWKE